jgi:hypothetical protein
VLQNFSNLFVLPHQQLIFTQHISTTPILIILLNKRALCLALLLWKRNHETSVAKPLPYKTIARNHTCLPCIPSVQIRAICGKPVFPSLLFICAICGNKPHKNVLSFTLNDCLLQTLISICPHQQVYNHLII